MNSQLAIQFALLAIVLVIGVLMLLYFRSSRREAEGFAAALGMEKLKSGHAYSVTDEDGEYHYLYLARGQNRPSSFAIWIDCPSPGDFKVMRESGTDRFFKRLGIAVEIQTGDVEFDRDYYLRGNSPSWLRACFGGAGPRDAVRLLFAAGYRRVIHDGRTLRAEMIPFKPGEQDAARLVSNAAGALRQLARDLPPASMEPHFAGIATWKMYRVAAYTLATTSLLAGIGLVVAGFANYRPLDRWEMFRYAMEFTAPAFLAYTVVSVMLLKGRSSSHLDLMFSFFMTLIGFPASGMGGTLVWNGYFDDSPAAIHDAGVIDKRYSRSRNSTRYFLELESWRGGRRMEEIRVGRGIYERTTPGGSVVRVTTRAGRLGFEWQESTRLLAARGESR